MLAPLDPLRRIPCLYHFTDARNAASIRELGGILSTARLNEMDVGYHAGGDRQSLDSDVGTSMDEYVHLCFTRSHPMVHRVLERNSERALQYLRIDRSILYQQGVKFANGMAYAHATQIFPIEEARDAGMIDCDVLYRYMNWSDPAIQARRRAAELCEILVPDWVPMEYISFLNG